MLASWVPTMPPSDYVHGYSSLESGRLRDQANVLADLLHHDTRYPAGSSVLEAGCGVGAQTVILAAQSPQAHITSIDISAESLAKARATADAAGIASVTFKQADVYQLPFADQSFDHVFVCFLLEHLACPLRALAELRRVLLVGGSMTVIEGDHGSAYFHPPSPNAQKTIECLVEIQARMGGNALVGRALFPILRQAGLRDIRVAPRVVYADSSRPGWVEGFTRNTFTAMVKGVRSQALALRLTDDATWEEGIRDLERTAEDDGTFNYTFFKATAAR
jgi:ubiquinone/menaquinone biosynthesis C-methylase UbiE